MPRTHSFRLLLLLFTGLLVTATVHAQTPTPPETAGIPGNVTLAPGDSVTFSNGAQSLQVLFQRSTPGGPSNVALVTARFDGRTLTLQAPDDATVSAAPTFGPPTCTSVNGLDSILRCSVTGGQVPFAALLTPPCPGGFACPLTLHYPSGWNLLAVTRYTVINSNLGPFFTWQVGDSAYNAVPDSGALQTGVGYWAYFDEATAIKLPSTRSSREGPACTPLAVNDQPPLTLNLAAGQLVMIGNPYSVPVNVAGADGVYTYDPVAGAYQPATMLQAGQGAWAYSGNGSTVTVGPPGAQCSATAAGRTNVPDAVPQATLRLRRALGRRGPRSISPIAPYMTASQQPVFRVRALADGKMAELESAGVTGLGEMSPLMKAAEA